MLLQLGHQLLLTASMLPSHCKNASASWLPHRRERYGLPPPAKQREIRGCSIDVKYIMKFPGHVAGKAAAREAALRQQLSMVIERYLREKQLTPEATSQAAHQDTQR